MRLVKKYVIEGSLQELLQQVVHDEHIIVCESDNPNYWSAHTRGVVFPHHERLLLNGEDVLYEGEFDDWDTCGDDLVIFNKWIGAFIRNGYKIPYQESYDAWRIHPEGVVIQKNRKLLLNGTHLLYEGDFIEWNLHAEGVVLSSSNDEILLNGKKKLYEGDWDSWESTIETGLVIKESNKFLLPDGRSLSVLGEMGGDWKLHPQGIMYREYEQFFLNPFSTAK